VPIETKCKFGLANGQWPSHPCYAFQSKKADAFGDITNTTKFTKKKLKIELLIEELSHKQVITMLGFLRTMVIYIYIYMKWMDDGALVSASDMSKYGASWPRCLLTSGK
jgi:hypothetical protein